MDVLFYCAVVGLIYFITPIFKTLFLGFQGLSQDMAEACFASSKQLVHYQFRAVLSEIADKVESGHFLGSAMMDLTIPQILYVITLFLLILTYYIVSSIAVPLALMAFLMAPIALAFEMLIEGILGRWLFFTLASFMYPTVSGVVFLIIADMNLFGAAREGVINANPFPGIMSNVFAIVFLGVVPTITGTLFFAPVLNFFSFVIGVVNFIYTDFISGSLNLIISKVKGGK
jgi:hypothetical protein